MIKKTSKWYWVAYSLASRQCKRTGYESYLDADGIQKYTHLLEV